MQIPSYTIDEYLDSQICFETGEAAFERRMVDEVETGEAAGGCYPPLNPSSRFHLPRPGPLHPSPTHPTSTNFTSTSGYPPYLYPPGCTPKA